MKMKSMRWGYDGGGMACGPVDGACIVEVCLDDNGQDLYVADSLFECYEHFWVTRKPVFEALMAVDMDALEEITNEGIEDFEYAMEGGDMTEETAEIMNESNYLPAIRFARMAMDVFDIEKDNGQTAARFMEPYIGRDPAEMTFETPEYEKQFLKIYGHGNEEDDEEDE